jgi:hypothetical protein
MPGPVDRALVLSVRGSKQALKPGLALYRGISVAVCYPNPGVTIENGKLM